MAALKQLPATVNVECVAGDPFTVTFTASSGVTAFTSPACTMTSSAGDAYTTDPGIPTASANGAALSTAWSSGDTAALNTTTKAKTYKWSTKAVADGGSSFQWYGGTITVHPVGTTGVSTSTSVTAAVTVGGVSIDATIIAGTGAASSVTITDAGGYYTGTTTEAALQELGASRAALPSLYRSDGMFPAAAYGLVVADGVTNCYSAIDAAITAAAVNGGTVLLPEGIVSIGDNTLTVPVSVSMRGCGRQSSTIKSTSATGKDVISLTGSRNTLADFRVQGRTLGGYAIALASSSNRITLENLQLESAGAGGVKFTASNFLVAMFEVEANSCTGNGFDVLGSGTHNALTLIACYANSCTGNGFQIYSAKGVNLLGCSSDNNSGYGYQMATARVNANGCTAENNTTGGFYVVGSGVVKLTMCSTNSQLLPFYINGSAETVIESPECTSTPSGHCVIAGSGGTNVRNRLIGGTLDRSVSISSGGYLIRDLSGTGSPEGSVVGSIGSTYRRVDGGSATSLYVKESGFSNTGWVGK